jgi:hypothetical protein
VDLKVTWMKMRIAAIRPGGSVKVCHGGKLEDSESSFSARARGFFSSRIRSTRQRKEQP